MKGSCWIGCMHEIECGTEKMENGSEERKKSA